MNRDLQDEQTDVMRKPLNAEVVQVSEECAYLDRVAETAELQRMINLHNFSLRNQS